MRIDLHAHSDASDGTEPPAEVMRRAAAAGLDVIALTDHDTTAGWEEAASALPGELQLVPGAEISCAVTHADGSRTDLHLLAYGFEADHSELAGELLHLRTDRVRRACAVVARLQELGADVTVEQVERIAAGASVGRPHLARALVEAGVVPDVPSAFTQEWIGSGGRAYVEKYALDPLHAVRLVRSAGGVAVFAHPGASRRGPTVGDDVIRSMAEAGLAGLEVDHPDHDRSTREHLRALAGDLGLVVTGASDDHGELTGHRLGCETTAPREFERLMALVA